MLIFAGADVRIIERGSWTIVASLKDGHAKDTGIVAWSPDGKYLASADVEGLISIWDFAARSSIHKYISLVTAFESSVIHLGISTLV